jgi:hypothetical protein
MWCEQQQLRHLHAAIAFAGNSPRSFDVTMHQNRGKSHAGPASNCTPCMLTCLQAFPAHTGEVLALQASGSQPSSFLVSGGTDFQVRPAAGHAQL